MRWLLLLVFSVFSILIPWGSVSNAAEITLSSVSATTLQNAVDDLKDAGGGTLILPTCDVNLGSSVIKVPGGIRIIGRGKNTTILRNGMFNFNKDHYGTVGDGLSRLSGMSIINPMDRKLPELLFRRVAGARLDNVYFEGRYSTFCNVVDVGYLIVDNCEFNLFTSYGFYVFGNNTYKENIGSLDAAKLLGTMNKGTTVVEDCMFSGYYDHLMDGRSGAHYMFRHNVIDYDSGAGPLEGHGPTTPGQDVNVGTNCIEIYDVDIYQQDTSGSAGILIRSGVAAIHNVAITNKAYGVALAVENSPYTYPRTTSDYPVYHQPHGVWIWNNTYQDIRFGDVDVVWDSGDCIQENRDYFLRAPSLQQDGFAYTPYPYPHPYRESFPVPNFPEEDSLPPSASSSTPTSDRSADANLNDGSSSSGSSGGGCFICSLTGN